MFCCAGTIDSGLYTTYETNDAKSTLYWSVCGSIGSGSGCYSSGQLGPFGRIGSMSESSKVYDIAQGTVTRYLYVIDQEYGSGQNAVALYAYKRVDAIVQSSDTTTFTLLKAVSLPLVGGASALVFMGANNDFLVIGTSNSTIPVEVNKRTAVITTLSIIDQIPTSISADGYGYVTVTSPNGFFVVGPDGMIREDGGGSPFSINTILGIQP